MRRESGLPMGVYPSHDEVCSGLQMNKNFDGLTDGQNACFLRDSQGSGVCPGATYSRGIRTDCFASIIKGKVGGGNCIKR